MQKPDIDNFLFVEDYLAACYNYRHHKMERKFLIVIAAIVFVFVVAAGVWAMSQ